MSLLRWSTWSRRDKVHAILVLIATIGVVGHQASMWKWMVEDSAISFSFARHLVEGEGLVAFRGGERVEGYSNPTWVLLLAAMQLVGLDPFIFVKWVSALIGALTVPIVYATVREETGEKSDLPVVAVIFLGCNSQFAIWGGAGLENGLLNFLIALGFWRMMLEVKRGLFPWSAAVWLLVALTRPEGIMYSAIAGFCSMVFHLHTRRTLMPTLQWLLVFFVPWGLYQWWHYQYFAWPLPNTYYGKLEDREPMRWAWDRKAWNWTRGFFFDLGQGFFLPIWALGVLGDGRYRYILATFLLFVVGALIELTHDQRFLLFVVVGTLWASFWIGLQHSEESPPRWLVWAATATAAALLLASEAARYFGMMPNPIPFPEILKSAPPYLFTGLALTLPLLGYGARGWQLRTLSWMFCAAVVFFAVYVQWDWMKGYRWYATAAVPGAILFAFGVDSFVRFVEEMFGWQEGEFTRWRPWSTAGAALAALLTLLQLPANVAHTVKVASSPDASPRSIKTRVDYVDKLRDRMHLEEPLVDLDVDQGAHLWWSDFEMMDIAGLVDVPFAHQKFERAFVREYVFQEKKPQYAHVHGGWASNSKIPTHPEWRKDYVEVPGYPAGKHQLHIGNFVRRDIFMLPAWPHAPQEGASEGPVGIEQQIAIYRPFIPSEPGAGRKLYVEVGMASTKARRTARESFRVVLFVAGGGHLASWEIPPGYDWLRTEKWTDKEVFVGKFDLPLPEDLPAGRYDLGMVVFGADGQVLQPLPAEQDPARPADVRIGGLETPSRLARGEVIFPEALVVLSPEQLAQAADEDFDAALASAEKLACEEAERSWWKARMHRAGEVAWADERRARMEGALATCWALSSDGKEQQEQVRRVARARRWDRWNEAYRERAEVLGQALYEQGLAARAQQDWETAYRRFSDAVEVDRSLSWARRYAEEARAFRLGIDPASKAAQKAAQEHNKQITEQRRKEAQEKAQAEKARREAAGLEDPGKAEREGGPLEQPKEDP